LYRFHFAFSLSYFVFVCDRDANLRALTTLTFSTRVFRHFPKIFSGIYKERRLGQPPNPFSTFGESFCFSYKQDCQAASAEAGPTEVNGGTHWRTNSGFAAEYLRLGD
jgi:hypothetical protein